MQQSELDKLRKQGEKRRRANARFLKGHKQSGYGLANKVVRSINNILPLNGNFHNSLALLVSSSFNTDEDDRLRVEQALIGLKSRLAEMMRVLDQRDVAQTIDITPPATTEKADAVRKNGSRKREPFIEEFW